MFSTSEVAFTIAIATVVLLFYYLYSILFKRTESFQEEDDSLKKAKTEENTDTSNEKFSKNKEKKSHSKPIKSKEVAFKHAWLSATLKAHSDTVTGIDFSSNGKYLLSSGMDRAIFLWSTKEFQLPQTKHIRCNVEFDHAFKVRFSPDSKSFITGLGITNTIRAYKITKKEDSTISIVQAAVQDFPQVHKADLINIGISCNAKFIMTSSRDTTIHIWDLKGDILGTIDTKMMTNSYAAVSSCGRFFGACGFTPDVKIWEVCFDKTGNYTQIKRAFELKGHSAGVYNFSFNADSSRIASVSKDLTWKLWNTKIDYERGQECDLLLTGELREKGPSMIALSPDAYTIAVVTNKNLSFFNGLTAECDQVIENICSETVNEILFSNDNLYLAVACDKHVKVFHNVTGHKVAIQDLEKNLKATKTEGAKERLEQLIDGHRKSIETILKQ